MSNPLVKEFNSIPLVSNPHRLQIKSEIKFAAPIRRYKFKPGYGGLIYRKINPIKTQEVSSHQRMLASSLVQQADSLNSLLASLTKIENTDFRYQIARSYAALEFWEKSPGNKIASFKDVIKENIVRGNDYTKDIKDIHSYGLRVFLRSKGSYKHTNGREYLVDNYNYCPPLAYLIMFEEKFDDMGECFNIPSNEIEKDVKKEISDIMQNLLPDTLDTVRKESLFQIKTTSSCDVALNKSKHYVQAAKSDITFTYKFRCRRERIQLSPQNNRDIGVCDLPTYYTVRMLDEYFLQILKNIESSALGSKGLMSKIHRHFLLRKNRTNFYYMRDYKKSALTFSHKLLQIMMDVLLKKYGSDSPFKYLSMYLNQEIRDGDNIIRPKRGFPLGMGNHLYTLVNVIATQMLRNRLPDCLVLTFLAGNDDSSLNVNITDDEMSATEAMDLVMRTDLELHDELDMILNEKKMFCAYDSVFFEEYSAETYRNKESLFYCGLGAIRLCETIAEAKLHCSNILSFAKFDVSKLLEMLVSYYGWEFYPDEYKYDYTLGGWYHKPAKNGLDIINLVPEKSLHDVSRAIRAVKETYIMFRDDKFTISTGKVSERYGIHPLREDFDESDPIRDFLLPNNRIINRGAKLEHFTDDLDSKFRNVQRRRMNFKGTSVRFDTWKYYLMSYQEHDIPETCIKDTSNFYNCDVVSEDIDNFINPRDLLDQFLLAKSIEGDIEVEEIYSDYISIYNSKYLGALLRSKRSYESSTVTYKYPKSVFIDGVKTEIYEKDIDQCNVINWMESYEIPFGLGDIANNCINRYVNQHYKFPVSYKEEYREYICTPRSITSYLLTPDENYLINELSEPEFVDQRKLWHSLSDENRPYIGKISLNIDKAIRRRRAQATDEEIKKSQLTLCDTHANQHEIMWTDEGNLPYPVLSPNTCYLCETLNDWFYRVIASGGKFDENLNTLNEVKVITRVIEPDCDNLPGWFGPKTGWGLHGAFVEEYVPQQEDLEDEPDTNEELVEDDDEIIEELEDEDLDLEDGEEG